MYPFGSIITPFTSIYPDFQVFPNLYFNKETKNTTRIDARKIVPEFPPPVNTIYPLRAAFYGAV